MKVARIYLRVSTDAQDLARQRDLVEQAKTQGYYIAGIYEDKASGTNSDRPGLKRMIAELQPGDTVIAEKIDRITRAPLPEAEALVAQIRATGATLAIPGLFDLSDIKTESEMARIVLESMQTMLLRITLQMARDDYETRRQRQAQGIAKAKQEGKYTGRPKDTTKRKRVAELLAAGFSVRKAADHASVSTYTVQDVKKRGA